MIERTLEEMIDFACAEEVWEQWTSEEKQALISWMEQEPDPPFEQLFSQLHDEPEPEHLQAMIDKIQLKFVWWQAMPPHVKAINSPRMRAVWDAYRLLMTTWEYLSRGQKPN
jgi:hypothetical protein